MTKQITVRPPYESGWKPKKKIFNKKQWLHLQEKYRLTPRELQVATLVCRGFSNDEITKDLKIGLGTAKVHLRNIFKKVGVKNKVLLLLRFVLDGRQV